MNIERLILNKIAKKRSAKVADIVKVTSFSRAYINRFFDKLEAEGKIVLVGKANKARYVRANKKSIIEAKKEVSSINRTLGNKNLSEDVVLGKIKRDTGIFMNLPENVSRILDYGFTEMLNNAIEHSQSPVISVGFKRNKADVHFWVNDKGIGIFRNIRRKRGLRNELEAIQDLLKGKQTTAPKEHTGEGIFFTSKAADRLVIKSFGKKLIYDNRLEDVFVEDTRPVVGTRVRFEVAVSSPRQLERIFKTYASQAFEFSRTQVIVKLYEMDTAYISRSQGRRIMSGLDKFKEIILDFIEVKTIGQAFADEVFRVWQGHHPQIRINYKNANENIVFMISRALRVKHDETTGEG